MSKQLTKAAQKPADLRAFLEQHKAQIALALPRHLSADRMLRVAMTAIGKTPKLAECDQRSLFAALIQASQLGLEPDGALGEAWLVPYWHSGKKVYEAQFQPGYRGFLALVRRSGTLSTIEARAVYAKDHFKFRYGLDAQLEHVPYDPGPDADPTKFDAGNLNAVYAIAKLRDGGVQWDVMRRHEVERVRSKS